MTPDPAVRVNSFDEWTRLREVVVGRAEHYTEHDVDTSWQLFFFENVAPTLTDDVASRRLLSIRPQLVDELNEDIAGLADALTGHGVRVLRPAAPGKEVDIRSPYWEARATPPAMCDWNGAKTCCVRGSMTATSSIDVRRTLPATERPPLPPPMTSTR